MKFYQIKSSLLWLKKYRIKNQQIESNSQENIQQNMKSPSLM